MYPNSMPGRGRRAPTTCLFLVLATAVACTTVAPAPTTAEATRDQKEGGTGTRAKGEEGSTGKRYAVAGPKDNQRAVPPPVAEAAPAAPLSPAPTGLGALGSATSGGGIGYGSGHGRLGGASRRMAMKAASPPSRGVLLGARGDAPFDTEAYAPIVESSLLSVKEHPLSTFSADVDTASFSNARRFLAEGRLPPKDSIRVEEWLNYFTYADAPPTGEDPVAIHTEVSSCPWAPEHRLVRIGIRTRPIAMESTPPRNLVFLLDVSGSMDQPNKLPLLKRGLALLARTIRPEDTAAIVVYAGASGLVLPPTTGLRQDKILDALEALGAGGSTNGGDGIRLAYSVARQSFKPGGVNRVILATDGDFNVGTTSQGELVRLIENERKSGVFLTVLGFGDGNLKDSTMELLADKGNGNYAYIDSLAEARKVLVQQGGATLVTVAKDVKLQVELNPARAESYRLVGYENRLLANEDFNDDRKDAGDLGAGHSVTALYEVVPVGVPASAGAPAVDPLKYQTAGAPTEAAGRGELLTVSVRYKPPGGDTSKKLSRAVADSVVPFARASADQRFAAAVAEAALVLRGSPALSGQSLGDARALLRSALGTDAPAERRDLVAMLDRAAALASTAQAD